MKYVNQEFIDLSRINKDIAGKAKDCDRVMVAE